MGCEISEQIDAKTLSGVVVHPTAILYRGVELGKNVSIGPGCIVGAKVILEDNVELGPYVIVEGRTRIGRNTKVSAFATLGQPPQDLKYKGEDTQLVVGENNQIKEYVNVSRGTTSRGITEVGNDNLLMAYTHIAHDCKVGSNCVFANGVQLAGHVDVHDRVIFGGMSGGHQFCRFGKFAMIGAGAIVVQDVAPFCMVQGDRARMNGLNVVGLRRAGIKGEDHLNIKRMYRILFRNNLTFDDALARIDSTIADSLWKETFVGFLHGSKRGICR